MPGREAANGNASEEPQTRFDAYQADPDPLTVVLSSSASLFSLSPPSVTSERRDVHRRTRRGKQRRTRPTPQVQSRLFDQRGSK
jgi:hypothetical protein